MEEKEKNSEQHKTSATQTVKCTYWEPNMLHKIGDKEVWDYIEAFDSLNQTRSFKFPYCGTIYDNPLPIDVQKEQNVLKCHYCLEDSNALYIAFEYDICADNDHANTGVNGECLGTTDNNDIYDRKWFPQSIADLHQHHVPHFPGNNRKLDPQRYVNPARENFKKFFKPIYNSENDCEPVSFFDRHNSIDWIYDSANAYDNLAVSGFRYYFGWDSKPDSDTDTIFKKNRLKIILAGVDGTGRVITPFRENSLPYKKK